MITTIDDEEFDSQLVWGRVVVLSELRLKDEAEKGERLMES
jgi:hypothetical protein